MTGPLTLTVIGFGPSAADSNARTGTALPINLFHWEEPVPEIWTGR